MDDNEMFVAIGKFTEQITALQFSVASLQGQVRTLTDAMSEAKGGWKVLMLIGGSSAFFGAAVHKLFAFLGEVLK